MKVIDPVIAGVVFDHRPAPGPGYWDWRCLRCSERVDRHADWLGRWAWRRLRKELARWESQA